MRWEEFLDGVGPYVSELWPECTLTKGQLDVWFSRLKHFSVDECKRGLAALFAEGNGKGKGYSRRTPDLEDVRKKVHLIHGAFTGMRGYEGEPDEPDTLPEMQRDVNGFLSPAEQQQWKALIMRKEPWTRVFEMLAVTSNHWISLIHSRAIREECEIPIGEGSSRKWTKVTTAQLWGESKKEAMANSEPDPLEGL